MALPTWFVAMQNSIVVMHILIGASQLQVRMMRIWISVMRTQVPVMPIQLAVMRIQVAAMQRGFRMMRILIVAVRKPLVVTQERVAVAPTAVGSDAGSTLAMQIWVCVAQNAQAVRQLD